MTYSRTPGWRALWSLLLVSVVALPAHARMSADQVVAFVEPAHAGTNDTQTGATGADTQLSADDAYRLALLKMKGHLSVARALLQLRAPGVDHQAGQSLQAIFQATSAELDRRSAPFTADILGELKHAVARDPVTAIAAVESAATALNGSFAQTGAMDTTSVLALAEALLREAVTNYAEAVSDNEVVNLPKYQSGRGFATEAEALVRHSGGLKGRPGQEKLLDLVTLIRQAWPAVVPPPIVFDPPSVSKRLDEAVAVIKEIRR